MYPHNYQAKQASLHQYHALLRSFAALFSRASRRSEAKPMKRYHNVMNGIQKFLADPKTNKSSQLIVFN
jgi:hypothetical protein